MSELPGELTGRIPAYPIALLVSSNLFLPPVLTMQDASSSLRAPEITFMEMMNVPPGSPQSEKLVTPSQNTCARLGPILEVDEVVDLTTALTKLPFEAKTEPSTSISRLPYEASLAVEAADGHSRTSWLDYTRSFAGVKSGTLPSGMTDDVDVDLNNGEWQILEGSVFHFNEVHTCP